MFSNKPSHLGMSFQNKSGLYAAGNAPQSPNVMTIGGRIKRAPFLSNIRAGNESNLDTFSTSSFIELT